MRGTTKRPQTAVPTPQPRPRRRGLSARRSRKVEMPPPRHPSERNGRKVARAVGDAIEYRYPDVADADDRDGVIQRGAEDQILDAQNLAAELHREQLGFPSRADPFGVAVPVNLSQFRSRPSTAPSRLVRHFQ